MGSERRGTTDGTAQPGAAFDPVILEIRYRPATARPESQAENSPQTAVEKAELARQLNASIYNAGQSLADQDDENFELTFVCACGCMAEIRRSLREYAIRGAVVDGHSRPAF
jgi:hypothetical protein